MCVPLKEFENFCGLWHVRFPSSKTSKLGYLISQLGDNKIKPHLLGDFFLD